MVLAPLGDRIRVVSLYSLPRNCPSRAHTASSTAVLVPPAPAPSLSPELASPLPDRLVQALRTDQPAPLDAQQRWASTSNHGSRPSQFVGLRGAQPMRNGESEAGGADDWAQPGRRLVLPTSCWARGLPLSRPARPGPLPSDPPRPPASAILFAAQEAHRERARRRGGLCRWRCSTVRCLVDSGRGGRRRRVGQSQLATAGWL